MRVHRGTTWTGSLWCCGATADNDKPGFGFCCPYSQVSPLFYEFPCFFYTSLNLMHSLFWKPPYNSLLLFNPANDHLSLYCNFWKTPAQMFLTAMITQAFLPSVGHANTPQMPPCSPVLTGDRCCVGNGSDSKWSGHIWEPSLDGHENVWHFRIWTPIL